MSRIYESQNKLDQNIEIKFDLSNNQLNNSYELLALSTVLKSHLNL